MKNPYELIKGFRTPVGFFNRHHVLQTLERGTREVESVRVFVKDLQEQLPEMLMRQCDIFRVTVTVDIKEPVAYIYYASYKIQLRFQTANLVEGDLLPDIWTADSIHVSGMLTKPLIGFVQHPTAFTVDQRSPEIPGMFIYEMIRGFVDRFKLTDFINFNLDNDFNKELEESIFMYNW